VPRDPGSSTTFGRLAGAAIFFALVAFVSGCGSSDETFTSGEADRALAALDSIQSLVDDGDCTKAARRVNTLAVQSTHVNDDRPQLGEAYASSVARLQYLVSRECVEIKPTSPTPAVTESTGSTGGNAPPATPDTGGTVPDAGGGGGAGGGQDNGNGDTGNGQDNGTGNGGDTAPPADSGGAGPGP
jgi:hypothetical protein